MLWKSDMTGMGREQVTLASRKDLERDVCQSPSLDFSLCPPALAHRCVCLSPGLITAPFSLLFTVCYCAALILHTFRLRWPHLVSIPVGPALTFPVANLCAGSGHGREDHQQPGNTENSPSSSAVIKTIQTHLLWLAFLLMSIWDV